MKKKKWMWLGGLAVVLVGVVALRARQSDSKSAENTLAVKVKRADLAIEVIETGRIQARERVELKSKVAGQVLEVLVDEGSTVEKEQVLLRLDPTDCQRDVSRAQAELALAQNALRFAELSLTRKKRALEDRGASQAEVDLAESEVRGKHASLKLAQVALGAASDRLRYTEVRSPIHGTVLERGIQPGEVVTPGVQATFEGKALLTVGDLSTLVVKAELNQIDVAKVKLGQKVKLSLDALPGKSYEAEVTKVAPTSVKPKNKEIEVFPVEATLRQSDAAIKPGMTADVRIEIETRPKALSVPIEAVVKEEGKNFVFKLAQAKGARNKVAVELGARNDREVEVVSGLTEGEELVIDPASSAANEAKL